ncbi:MAG: hypothetical protein HY332_08420 [Chloroflexi bacterium]|nr:hypothetical protein [Chloroflexota bacterium]
MTAAQTTASTATAKERAAVEPFARQLLELARRIDPAATYTLAPPIDPGTWVMHLYVRGDLVDDPDLSEAHWQSVPPTSSWNTTGARKTSGPCTAALSLSKGAIRQAQGERTKNSELLRAPEHNVGVAALFHDRHAAPETTASAEPVGG